uniref:Secreted protein n=1 Tax=Opuntia streptacantha TaxID=393608 RepID=A0A7C8YJF4_OPUST
MCSATVYKLRILPLLLRCGTFVLTVTFSPTQSCDALVTDGPPAYPTCWGAWRDIEVGYRLTLIPLVTGPLPSPQKVNLKRCAAPPFISPGPSHLFSDVGLFVLTVTFSSTQSL